MKEVLHNYCVDTKNSDHFDRKDFFKLKNEVAI